MSTLTEVLIPNDYIGILPNGDLEIREAYVVLRDGVADPDIPKRYNRYVIHNGDDVSGRDESISSVAAAIW